MYDRLEAEAKRWHRTKCPFVVIILDIDYFKKINDTYGHLTGDVILKEFSRILKEHTRQKDYVGRFGGDEFLIIRTESSISEGNALVGNIRKTIENETFLHDIRLSVSMGIEEYMGQSLYELIETADSKLYEVKNNGRIRNKLSLHSNLLNLSDEAIFAWEPNGLIILWNKGAENIYGYSSEEAMSNISHSVLKTIHPNGSTA